MLLSVLPSRTSWASLSIASVSSFPWYVGVIDSCVNDESVIMSPSVLVKFSIDECICGINVDIDGASHLINDIHGLNVTTISPNSETVFNLILICSIDNFALPILSLTFLISINSVAYVLYFDSFRVNFSIPLKCSFRNVSKQLCRNVSNNQFETFRNTLWRYSWN